MGPERPAPGSAAQAIAAATAALRALDDAAMAEKLLVPLAEKGPKDVAVYQGLLETYRRLGRPRDVARMLAALEPLVEDEETRTRLVIERAQMLAEPRSSTWRWASPMGS